MSPPLVSIVVPTLNRLELLVQTLRSITLQDYGNLELIVSNNASKDGTFNFLSQLQNDRFQVINRPFTIPMEANVNDAVKRARGKYLLLLSDDDLISGSYISTMVQAFETDDTIQAGLGLRVLIDGESRIVHQADPLSSAAMSEPAEPWLIRYFASPVAHNQINTVFSTFYRRTEWLRFEQPTLSASYFSDTIPFVGVNSPKSKIFYAPEAVFLYRIHQKQESTQATSVESQTYLGLFQFFEHLRPILGDFSRSEHFKRAITQYMIMMFRGACGRFLIKENIDPSALQTFFYEFLDQTRSPADVHVGMLHGNEI
ncbi:Glycosyl transferase family 2 [Methylobacterium phyllostachyos]|uniref:Glycosyl transferase family 2 n=1 Tax=Methylobacterium phyllostachyos TaxID=582672 RepID=A0A1H0GGF7_9HYPH|nr:glycosyltransferase [Methylobacterium phyllostachyos]SDO05974.1 Glycosyl transferase family 2 [Methylobacterium phyllostachyos]